MIAIGDEMSLDTMRRFFATRANNAWAGTIDRVMRALRSNGLLETAQAVSTPSDPGGAYIGLTRGGAPNAHSMLHRARQANGPAERMGGSYAIQDSRAPGVNAAHPRKREAE